MLSVLNLNLKRTRKEVMESGRDFFFCLNLKKGSDGIRPRFFFLNVLLPLLESFLSPEMWKIKLTKSSILKAIRMFTVSFFQIEHLSCIASQLATVLMNHAICS